MAPSLPTIIRLGCKWTNTLAYHTKKFYNIGPKLKRNIIGWMVEPRIDCNEPEKWGHYNKTFYGRNLSITAIS